MATFKHRGLHTVIHDKTGEISELNMAYVVTTFKHFKKGEFFTMSKYFAEFMASEAADGLGKVEIKLMFALLNRIQVDNTIKRFRQKDIGEEIKVAQPNVARSMKKLISHDILFYNQKDDCYEFNNALVFSGKAKKKKKKRESEIHPHNMTIEETREEQHAHNAREFVKKRGFTYDAANG